MNKALIRLHFSRIATLAGTFVLALALCTPLHAQTNSKGEEFFIISSVDQKTHQVVLMRPTQLTVAASVGPQTVVLGEKGQKMAASELRAGDTVWAVVKPGKNGVSTALRIREGAMTQAEMQRLYLHYSPTAPEEPLAKPVPLSPAPQTGSAQPPAVAPSADGSNALLRRHRRPGDMRIHRHGPGGPAHS